MAIYGVRVEVAASGSTGWTSSVTRRALNGAWWKLPSMVEIGFEAGGRVVWLLRAMCWVRASCKITWMFKLDACTGMYGMEIIFDHYKDYYDAGRNRGLYLKNTRSNGTVTVPYVRRARYRTFRYGTLTQYTSKCHNRSGHKYKNIVVYR